MSILDRIRAILRKPQSRSPLSDQASQPQGQPGAFARLDHFMRMLEHTQEEELSCEDVFWLMAQYAEALEEGKQPEELMPMVKQHLDMCQECQDELEAVLAVLEATRS